MSPEAKPVRPVVVYTRVSEQGRRSDEELLSHEIQRDKVTKYLAAVDVKASSEQFEDTDRSGGKMSRPAFDRAVQGVLEGKYGGIAVARLSRFARTVREALELIERIEAAGGTVIAVDVKLDTSTAIGRAILTVLLAFSTLEREQAVEQAGLTAELKLSRGESLGGKAPCGYRFKIVGQDSNGKQLRGNYVRDEPAASIVADAFTRFDRRELASVGRVADFLNENGLRTRPTKKHPDGQLWNIHNVKGLLQRESYTGVRTYGDLRIPDAHDAIVPAGVFRRVQRRLEPKQAARTRVRGDGHILGEGLMRCGKCGGGLSKSVANGSYQTLRCTTRGQGHASISRPTAEDWVVGVAFAHAGMSMPVEGGNAEEVAAADTRLESARAELAEVDALRGTVAAASFALAHSDALAAFEEAVDARAELEPDGGTVRLVFSAGNREKFDALAVPEQRAALRSIVKQAVVAPGRGHVSQRITVEFQDGEYHPAHRAPGWKPKLPVAAQTATA